VTEPRKKPTEFVCDNPIDTTIPEGRIEGLMAHKEDRRRRSLLEGNTALESHMKANIKHAVEQIESLPESDKPMFRAGEYAIAAKEANAVHGALPSEKQAEKESAVEEPEAPDELEEVDHPDHYGGGDNPYEAIKVIQHTLTPEEFRGFIKGNVLKYTMRAGKKAGTPGVKDMAKAEWCLNFLNAIEPVPSKRPSGSPSRRQITFDEAIALSKKARTDAVKRREDAAQEEADRMGRLDD
jgi:hypothetical protein